MENGADMDEVQQRTAIGVRGQLVGLCMGLAIGMAIYAISFGESFPGARTATVALVVSFGGSYRGVATATVALVLAATHWLREGPRAPITRYVTFGLLALALCAALLVVILPLTWQGPMTLASAVLVSSAVVILAGLRIATRLLLGAVVIGFGMVPIGVEVAGLLVGADWTSWAAAWAIEAVVTGFGAVFIGLGVAILRRSYVLAGVAIIGAGVVVTGLGVPGLWDGHVLAGGIFVGFGVLVLGGLGATFLAESRDP
jgi:hypothetical protein